MSEATVASVQAGRLRGEQRDGGEQEQAEPESALEGPLLESGLFHRPALERLRSKHGVRIEALPPEVLKRLRAASTDVVADLARTGALVAALIR